MMAVIRYDGSRRVSSYLSHKVKWCSIIALVKVGWFLLVALREASGGAIVTCKGKV